MSDESIEETEGSYYFCYARNFAFLERFPISMDMRKL